jgi:hypothetical protein
MKIKDILVQSDQNVIISKLKGGRKTPLPSIEDFKKQLDPKEHDVMKTENRPDKKVKVDAPNRSGMQVTTGGESEGGFRLEPVARIALALQRRIVKSAASFTFGNPVDLIASPAENTKEDAVLAAVKRVLYDNKDKSLNKKVARTIFSSTEAAEIWYPVPGVNNRYGFESAFKLRCAVFDPLQGDVLYPFFDENGDLVAFSREFTTKDENDKDVKNFESYLTTEGDGGAYHYAWTERDGKFEIKEGFPVKL